MRRGLSYHGRRNVGNFPAGGGTNPFFQSGPTLDLNFAGAPVTSPLLAGSAQDQTLQLSFLSQSYAVAAQYAIWGYGGLTSDTFSNIVTFTRASTATYFNSAGTLTTAAINEARFDYNPSTLAAQGLLIEEQRTNSIRNNTMQGAVAGTPGTDPTNWVNSIPAGITQQIVGTGTESGITYIDYRFSGTATGSIVVRPDGETQVVASSGQAWTGSIYVRLIAGTLTNVSCDLNMRQGLAAGGLVLNTSFGFTPTSAALNTQRIVNAVASMQPTTERIINRVILNITGAIDITLRIGLPQLEQGAFATSVIPTTTTALTRSADVASVNTLSPWYNATEGTLFADYATNQTQAAFFPAIDSLSDGTNGNRIQQSHAGNARRAVITSGGVSQWDSFGGALGTTVAGVSAKFALAYKASDFAACVNAGTVVTQASGSVPSVSRLNLGADGAAANWLNGYLRRLTYYPRRLPNADLQTITA